MRINIQSHGPQSEKGGVPTVGTAVCVCVARSVSLAHWASVPLGHCFLGGGRAGIPLPVVSRWSSEGGSLLHGGGSPRCRVVLKGSGSKGPPIACAGWPSTRCLWPLSHLPLTVGALSIVPWLEYGCHRNVWPWVFSGFLLSFTNLALT